MAPRTAKAKKTADVKVADVEAPKKGRGKAKNVEENEQEVPEIEIDEKTAPAVKGKRGKKAQDTNGDLQAADITEDTPNTKAPETETDEKTAPVVKGKRGKKAQDTNGDLTEDAPPAKKGRKKNEPIPEKKVSNEGNSDETEAPPETEHNGDIVETNGTTEDTPPKSTGRGRKKQAIKDEKPKETNGRGKKGKQANEEAEEKEIVEEKPKGKGRGRKAAPKAEDEEDKTENGKEEVKPDPVKGKKKGQSKKEKTPESEKEASENEEDIKSEPTKGKKKGQAKKEKSSDSESNYSEQMEEKTEEPKKKETKGRKAKKAPVKEESEDKNEDNDDEIKESAPKKRKVNKKDDRGKGDAKDDDLEEVTETKSAKGKRGAQKKAVEAPTETEEKAPADAKKKAPLKNKGTTNYAELDFSNSSKSPQGKEWNFKIASWNVDGVRAWMSKGGLDYIKYEKPDILCLQELKCAQDKLPEEIKNLPGYHAYWLASDVDGYAGVGIYTTRLAINVQYGLQNEELDSEGRIITAEYEQFYLICTYVPNAGRQLVTLPKRLRWNDEFRKHVKQLDKKKPVIICGDMNVAHNEIDLKNPKTNKKNAGFTEEERAGMTDLLGDGFVDTYRHLYPDKTGAYTFWTYMMNARSKNVGWRLDYFIVSERLLPSVCDNVIRDQVYGSDHCPISLFLHLTSADKPKNE